MNMNNKATILFFVALAIVSGPMVYFWYQGKNITESSGVAQKNKSEVKKLVAEILEFLVLPEDEEPTVATVTDLNALKDQPFFSKAQLGDKVIIYTKARKAVLFNPITNKVVEVAPINLREQSLQP